MYLSTSFFAMNQTYLEINNLSCAITTIIFFFLIIMIIANKLKLQKFMNRRKWKKKHFLKANVYLLRFLQCFLLVLAYRERFLVFFDNRLIVESFKSVICNDDDDVICINCDRVVLLIFKSLLLLLILFWIFCEELVELVTLLFLLEFGQEIKSIAFKLSAKRRNPKNKK